MSQLDTIRKSLPWASKLNDAELLQEVSTRVGMPMQDVAQAFGVRSGRDMGVMRSGLSSGVDQLQSLGYSALGGLSDAVGFDRGRDWANRRAEMNQAEAELYGRPELERVEDQSLGSARDFAGYQIAKQVPMIAGILGAQFVPGVGQASGALGLTRLGATAPRILGGGGLQPGASMAARRTALAQGKTAGSALLAGTGIGYGALYQESVEGGDPSPYLAMAGAVPFGAAQALVPAAVRGALRAPAEFSGNLLTRTLKAGGLASVGEAGTELFQNELEMGMRNDLSAEDKFSRRLNSAVVGGLVGGSFGTLGGVRGPRTVDEGEFDLTAPPPAAPAAGQLGSVGPLQTRIDQNLGINRERVGRDYASQFSEAFNEPSGVFVADPQTGVERELTMGELQQQQAGVLDQSQAATSAEVQQLQTRFTELTDKLADKAGLESNEIQELAQITRRLRELEQGVAREQQQGETPSIEGAPPAPPAPSMLTESDQFYANVVEMPIPQGKARREVLEKLYNDAVASGVPLESAALDAYWNQISTGNYFGKNQQDKLRVLLQNAIVEHRRQEASNVSTESMAAGAVTGSSGQPNTVADGSVGAGGPNTVVRDGPTGATGDTGAAVGQTGVVADPGTQSTTTVDDVVDAPTELTDAEQNQIEIARMTGQDGLADTVQETAEGRRVDDPTAGDEATIAAEVDKILQARFADVADPAERQRQTQIARAYLTAMRAAPQGSKVKLQEAIGNQFGVKPGTVRKYGNTTKLVEAAKALGYTDAQARGLFEINDNTKARAGEAVATQAEAPNVAGALQREGVATAEGENVGFGLDDSNTWKLANVKDGAGDTRNATDEQLANAIQSQLQAIDDLQQSLMELEQQGLVEAVEQTRELIAKEQAKLDKAMKAYEDHLVGKKTKATQAQAKVEHKLAKGKKAQPKTEQIIEDDVFMTPTEQAAAAWNEVADNNPNVPSWESLSNEDQNTFVEFGPDNWTRQDVIKFAQDAGPDFMRESRRSEKHVDADGRQFRSTEASLEEVSGAYDGVRLAVDRLNQAGLDNSLAAVDAWEVTTDPVPWDAVFGVFNGRRTIVLSHQSMQDKYIATIATLHEVGHAAENVHEGGDFSSEPAFNIRRRDGKIVAAQPGSVADEMIQHFNGPETPFSQLIAYPLDPTDADNRTMPVDEVRQEMFAQAWAFAATPQGMKYLQENLPKTAAFMERVNEQIKQATYTGQATQQGAQPGQVQGRGQAASVPVRASRQKAPSQGLVQRNIAKLPKQAQQPVRNTINGIHDVVRKALDRVVFTHTLIERAVKNGIKSAQTFSRLLAERAARARELELEVEAISDMYADIADVDKGDGPRSLNQFLFESTRTGKWGYGDKADPEMAAWFDELKPSSQKMVKAIFAHGDKIMATKKQTVINYANSEFDAQIANAKADGNVDLVKELEADKKNILKQFDTLFKVREGLPYAPIKRMGDYVVVAKSAAYRKAEQDKDTATLRKLEKDPDHYHVSFTDTKNEARNLADRLMEQGHFGNDADAVTHFERTPNDKNLFGDSSEIDGLVKLRSKVDEREGKGQAELQRMVTDLWLTSLAENSARKSEMRRRGVSGEVDMLRSFANQGRADAMFIASMQYNPQTQDALQAMRDEVARGGGDRDRKSQIHNEILDRYARAMDVVRNPAVDKITRMSSVYFLASSPMYYLQNATQPWMMSVPAMASRHDYFKVSKALWDAYSDLGPIMKAAKLMQGFDFSKVPDDVRPAIQELVKRGRIDIGLDTELGEFRIDGQGAFADGWNKVDKALRLTVQKGEAINRLSSGIAAYRLEMSKTKDHQKALDYADKILLDTHGDYGRFAAPKYFNTSLGRVALQFRKFQLIQMTFYAKLIRDAFADNRAQRVAAQKSLAFALGHSALMAGAMGMPGYMAISWALSSLFGDDDEPFDLTLELRKLIGDEAMANLIMRGAPTLVGSDISGKVGAGMMLSVMPFSNADLSTPRGQAEAFGTMMGGASLGMGMRMADGLGLMMSGDWMRGSELLLPKGLGDAIKGYRLATDGMTRRNGDIILPPEEISAVEAMMTAIGMSPAKTILTNERRQRARDMDQNFQQRATSLKNQYAKAVRNRDSKGMREAQDAWMKLQDTRVRNGYTRQPLSNLFRAPQEQDKRERDTVGGVQTNRSNRDFARMQSEL